MKLTSFFVISCVIVMQLLPVLAAEKYQITEVEADELKALIVTLNRNERPYMTIALQKMLSEIDYFSEHLHLPVARPLQATNIDQFNVSSPWFSLIRNTNFASPVQQSQFGKIGVAGHIETTNFHFYFQAGRLWSLVNKDKHIERFRFYPTWAAMPSLINSNSAYQLATQWLASVEMNTALLEKKYGSQKTIEQAFFWNQPGLGVEHPPGDTNKTMLPIFTVAWGAAPGGNVSPAASVEIFGPTKELMQLRVGDDSLFRRPPLIVSSVADFEKFIKAQTNLPKLQFQHPAPPTNSTISTNLPANQAN
jgi:hypothetical protein